MLVALDSKDVTFLGERCQPLYGEPLMFIDVKHGLHTGQFHHPARAVAY